MKHYRINRENCFLPLTMLFWISLIIASEGRPTCLRLLALENNTLGNKRGFLNKDPSS